MNKRPVCTRCLRAAKACICKFIHPVANRVSLIILQHPQEVHEAKNSARLLHLCLKNSQIYTGEDFESSFFCELKSTNYHDLLLYPDMSDNTTSGVCGTPKINPDYLAIDDNLGNIPSARLWVLDATWRKSRKMMYLNPALQAMPKLSLQDCPPSMYKIRKAHSKNQLSTLEASCYALQKLEHGAVNYSPILEAFAAFVAQRQAFLPSSL
jgi:DTW domain-containing protein YfiP